MPRTLLLASAVCALLAGCPEFPRDVLHYEGGSGEDGCRDRDGDRYTTCDGDCDDDARDAHPGQTAFFPEPIVHSSGGGSFDYDCDRREEQEITDIVDCRVEGEACIGEGWAAGVPVPPCGETGAFIECQMVAGKKCNERPAVDRVQACR